MTESPPKKVGNNMGKGKTLLVTNNSFFSNGVFKKDVLQTRKKGGLFGEGSTINHWDA